MNDDGEVNIGTVHTFQQMFRTCLGVGPIGCPCVVRELRIPACKTVKMCIDDDDMFQARCSRHPGRQRCRHRDGTRRMPEQPTTIQFDHFEFS
jgi:hypothetical protein